jgi:protein-S-isoprenylcysteine O-methyltransferase Ste14
MLRIAPVVLAYLSWLTFILTWNLFDRQAKTTATPPAQRERLHLLLIAFGIVMLVLAPVIYPLGRIWVHPPALDWLMLLLLEAGIAWCWWARRHLGRFWSAEVTRKEGHRVIETGPYRFVRHPMYVGMIVMYLGIAVICTTPPAFVGALLMTLGLWLKARVEERFLIDELGAVAYGAYQTRTPMLVPRLRVRHVDATSAGAETRRRRSGSETEDECDAKRGCAEHADQAPGVARLGRCRVLCRGRTPER